MKRWIVASLVFATALPWAPRAVFPQCTAPPAKGYLDHVSLDRAYGWACDPQAFGLKSTVDLYASGTPGDGTCRVVAGTNVCRVGTIVADQRRETAVGSACGGDSFRGFRFVTPPALLDRETHAVYAFARDYPDPATLHQLGPAFSFNADVLYAQEQIGAGAIDEHVITPAPATPPPGFRLFPNLPPPPPRRRRKT